jgi:hypothetical protein
MLKQVQHDIFTDIAILQQPVSQELQKKDNS